MTVKNNVKVRERIGPLRNNIAMRQAASGLVSEWEEEKEEIMRFLEGRCQFHDPGEIHFW